MKGKIIVIEGTDGSGKATQTQLLLEKLEKENISCKVISFPRYNTPTGRIIGQCYLGKKGLGEGDISWFGEADKVNPKIASLYYAADRLAAKEEIERLINSGTTVILDRYVESNMGHQAGKERNAEKREEIIKFINDFEYGMLNLPKPSLVIFLYMPLEKAVELRKKRGEGDGHESNIEHLKRAEETYIYLAGKFNWKRINCVLNDKIKTPKEIHEEVIKMVDFKV